MKKLFFVLSFFTLFTVLFAQNNYTLVSQITTTSVNNSIQIDIFFEESVNPKSLSSETIFINGNPINQNTKITFNREGNQFRFLIDAKSSFTLEIKNARTNSGKTVNLGPISLTGDSTWKKY